MTRKTVLALALAAAAAAALPAQALTAADLLYERTLMGEADRRCGLFAPDLGSALNAARLQARSAALRSGADDSRVGEIERRARARAAAAACASGDVATAAGRVRAAFQGWRDLTRMDFAGERQGWAADRGVGREPRWRLRQDTRLGFERATLGVGGTQAASALVVSVEGAAPSSARLVVRNVVRSPRPTTTGALAARGARGAGARVFLAEGRSAAPRGLRCGRGAATSFRFPAAAMAALEGLDAREAVAVEFSDARGRVRTAWFEVGDFAAARVFLSGGRG